jgi:hypothetical protein
MAEEYKSVLEKHNEELARKRREFELGGQAIENFYPEEYLIGGPGKVFASSFLGSGRKAVKDASRERIANVKIGSKVPSPEALKADKAVSDKFYKTPQGQATYEALKKQAERRKEIKDLKTKERELLGSAERAYKNFSGEAGYTVGSMAAEERRNAAGDTYKKGGKVSSASKRGDGCAVRGKTKGKIV